MEDIDMAKWFRALVLDISNHVKEGTDIVFDETDDKIAKLVYEKLGGK